MAGWTLHTSQTVMDVEKCIGDDSSASHFCLLLQCSQPRWWMPEKWAKLLLSQMLLQPPLLLSSWQCCQQPGSEDNQQSPEISKLDCSWDKLLLSLTVWKSDIFTLKMINKGVKMFKWGLTLMTYHSGLVYWRENINKGPSPQSVSLGQKSADRALSANPSPFSSAFSMHAL